MKIKDGFVLRSVAGRNVIMTTGETRREFKSLIKLNDTASEIWNLIITGLSEPDIAAHIAEEYGIGIEKAEADVRDFISGLTALGVIEQ